MFKNITKGFLLIVTAIVVFFYLLSATAPFISTANVHIMGFLGLAFPFLLIVVLLLLIFWLAVSYKYALLPFIALLLSSYSISHFFSFNFKEKQSSEEAISILTYNVKIFDLYNWSRNEIGSKAILDEIINANADIVCLQEFYTDNSDNFNMLKKLHEFYPYAHVEITLTLRGTDKWGIATFSKFPIRRKEKIVFENAQHNLAIASDIFVNNKLIKVYNTHLQSIHLNYDEIESIENITDTIIWKPTGNIFAKLRYAYYWRALQAEKLKANMNKANAPIILCGDFNDSPNSYVYRTLSKNLQDSFDEAGLGVGQTYFGKIPAFRIDYILADSKFNISKHQILRNIFSDHFAVKATMSLQP